MRNLRDVKILDLIPPNLKQDPTIQAAAKAIDGELTAVTESIRECFFYARIDELPEQIVDELAWQLHVDFYEPDLPIDTKRLLVKNSLPWHMRKGTPAAVEELITALFDDGQVVEWFDYGGKPYFFKVVTFNQSVTQERAEAFIRAVNTAKNKRSRLEKVEITQVENLPLNFGTVVHVGDNEIIRQVV